MRGKDIEGQSACENTGRRVAKAGEGAAQDRADGQVHHLELAHPVPPSAAPAASTDMAGRTLTPLLLRLDLSEQMSDLCGQVVQTWKRPPPTRAREGKGET